MSIQQYGISPLGALVKHPNGRYMLHADHLAEVERIDETWRKQAPYILGVLAERQRIVSIIGQWGHSTDCPIVDDEPCECGYDNVLSAISGGRTAMEYMEGSAIKGDSA